MIAFGSPHRYVQGDNLLDRIGEVVAPLGERFFLFGDEVVLSLVGERIAKGLWENKKLSTIGTFGGECSYPEIFQLTSEVRKREAHVIIGAGGGKAADTAKILGTRMEMPVVIVPTIASTDAPTSHLAVVYDENHVKQDVVPMKTGPAMVLVDTGVIARAPGKLLVAGLGDALSTRFEAEACALSGAHNMFGMKPSLAALHLARLSYEIIRADGEEALQAVEEQKVTQALENVIEAVILLSGLGFESGGLAAAHAVHTGFTAIPDMNRALHGELVGFGVLVQLVLEGRDDDFLEDLLGFYTRVGLPMRLQELGLKEVEEEKLAPAVERMCRPGSYMHNMPGRIDEQAVIEAIFEVNGLAERCRGRLSGNSG